MTEFEKIKVPEDGEKIVWDGKELQVPDNPIIPQIEGDGTGKDVSPAAKKVLKAAARETGRDIHWMDIHAGKTAKEIYGKYLPQETLDAIEEFRLALKGPLTTPVGGGFRSLNVAIRQKLDLYACVRPVYHLAGVPSPVKNPEQMDMVIFRENTEDVYAGIEWARDTKEAEKARDFLSEKMDTDIPSDSGIGIKPISEGASKRLIRKAIDYTLKNRDHYESMTLVHKGNIMKFTEGAFRDWGYEVAEDEYSGKVITEDELWEEHDGKVPEDVIVIKDRLADNMLQQLLTRTPLYDVLAMPNLNGDYLSDAAAGQVGGLGIAPGSNIGDGKGVFEPTHGTAPVHAGKDKVNPTGIILSGRIMFEFMGWEDAGELVKKSIEQTIKDKTVTYDIHRQIEGGKKVKCSEFADLVIENMKSLS
ncbi:isocitrate dehydrogenase [candidate division MSBL1 archaeon SCGC-AAA261O19]|uniref:Isocitrate dehydrogenase (NADP(+)) n=2 Tax=candidate division MSBL1 TaxID=215777 RepID=A0A133UYQ8_9EURY|nr:isocitrate dehydrogenase [candidate division MSBL1 archaeon SCGC-AAA261C02]KXB04614.1 isocitrate dehydrogenase [candidate division MSBL1 archaeon SCGC-AAA261O19]